MRKMLYFVETPSLADHAHGGGSTATSEAVLFPADHVTTITVQNDQAIRIWFKNSDGQTNDNRIDITGIVPADTAEEVAEYFAQLCAPGSGMGYAGIYKFFEGQVLSGTNAKNAAGASVAPPVLTTIAYTVGA